MPLEGQFVFPNSLISTRYVYRWSRGKSWQKHKHDPRPRLRMYWFKRQFKRKMEKLCSIIINYVILCYGIKLKQQFEEEAVACLLHCLQPDNIRIHKVLHTVKQSGNPPYSLNYHPVIFTSLVPKRRSTRTPLLIGWGGKGDNRGLGGTATRILLLRNLCLSASLEEGCTTCWGLFWKLSSQCV